MGNFSKVVSEALKEAETNSENLKEEIVKQIEKLKMNLHCGSIDYVERNSYVAGLREAIAILEKVE